MTADDASRTPAIGRVLDGSPVDWRSLPDAEWLLEQLTRDMRRRAALAYTVTGGGKSDVVIAVVDTRTDGEFGDYAAAPAEGE